MDGGLVFHQLLRLFIIMFLGYFLYKFKVIDTEFNKKLSSFLINVTLPATAISSVLEKQTDRNIKLVLSVFAIGFVMYIVLPVLGFIVARILRSPASQRGMYSFMMTFSNVGFIGFPITEALFGASAMFYTAIINIVFNLAIYSYGIILVNKDKISVSSEQSEGQSKVKLSAKDLISPAIIASVIAVIIYFTGVTIPADIASVINYLGDITSPLAMIIIGVTLAPMKLKTVFSDWRVYLFTVIKLIIIPIACLPLLKMVISDDTVLMILYILLQMPVANTSVLFANRFDINEELAAKGVFITTLFSVFTVPLMVNLCL